MTAALAIALGPHSVLDPAGPQAARVEWLWWVLFAGAAVAYAGVMITVGLVLLRARRADRTSRPPVTEGGPGPSSDPARERRLRRGVGAAVAASVVVLFAVMIASFQTSRAMSTPPTADPVAIRLTGHQWWWEARYDDPVPGNIVTTANEIHIPVGRPVAFTLTSGDVIHSLWVPSLSGKRDLIPGQNATIWFMADKPGVYRGQCAEFCGFQHAKMAIAVVAESPEEFAAWLERQRQPAVAPADPGLARGQQIFLSGPCVMCHAIGGTSAGSRFGPDLTHVASRTAIAGETLENTRGHLAGWILDSQEIKPGNHMPPVPLAPGDLEALLTYVESLK
jgi:cytochrome c oxidase subunit 2